MTRLDPDAAHDAIEYCYEQGWSDGLPVVPASDPQVERFLATTDRGPDEVIGHFPQLDRSVTVRTAAINAVMAGCRPEYFPVVLAAWAALMLERTTRGGAWQSTSGPAPLLIVNGPVRQELGFNSTGGVFGPGFRANMTVPRAIGLMVRNAFGVHPQVLEQATQGVPGRWTTCIAENEEESPWPALARECGVAEGSAVTATLLRTCEFVDNRHTSSAEQLLLDFADTLGRSGPWIFRHASAAIVFCPEHANMLAGAGFDRAEIRRFLHERAGRTAGQLAAVGKSIDRRQWVRGAEGRGPDPDQFQPILPSAAPESLPIAVAGSRNAGISMVCRMFADWSGRSVPIVPAHRSRPSPREGVSRP